MRYAMKLSRDITVNDKRKIKKYAEFWGKCNRRTEPIEPNKIIPIIEGLYEVSGLKKPRVIIVPSPLIMAFVYGAASAIWYKNLTIEDEHTASYKRFSVRKATNDDAKNIISNNTIGNTLIAMNKAMTTSMLNIMQGLIVENLNKFSRIMWIINDDINEIIDENIDNFKVDSIMRNIKKPNIIPKNHIYEIDSVIDIIPENYIYDIGSLIDNNMNNFLNDPVNTCYKLGGDLALKCAAKWLNVSQNNHMHLISEFYVSACRDIFDLPLPEYEKYYWWEQAAIHGGFRVMHKEFCIISDFPEIIKLDAQNRPHCDNGPSYRWRDGWGFYHWHGVQVPKEWIENKNTLTATDALRIDNAELRRAACEILGWENVISQLKAVEIDADLDPEIGTLLRVDLPNAPQEQFLRVKCGTGRLFVMPVPPNMRSAVEAQAWLWGLSKEDFIKPEYRT